VRFIVAASPIPLFSFQEPSDAIDVPYEGLGRVFLPRTELVNTIVKCLIENETRNEPPVHHYFPAPRASGKSVFLDLVGRELQSLGKPVFLLEHAGMLDEIDRQSLLSLGSPGRRAYLLIDEVQAYSNDLKWTTLLKKGNKHVVVIGVGTRTTMKGSPGSFTVKHKPSEMRLNVGDVEHPDLVAQYTHMLCEAARSTVTLPSREKLLKVVRSLLLWLQLHTNGHVFPLLKLAEYCVTTAGASEKLVSQDFSSIVGCGAAVEDPVAKIFGRSFEIGVDEKSAARKIFEGKRDIESEEIFGRLGLWDGQWFTSPFFVQCLFQTDKVVEIPFLTIQSVIEYALSDLNETHFSQFDAIGHAVERYENSISSFIGWKLSTIISLYVSPQNIVCDGPRKSKFGMKPTADFYINGELDHIIEVTRNSSNLSEHFDRFEDENGSYSAFRERYVILDIIITGLEPKLPKKYVHCNYKYFAFVKPLNRLFRGGEVVKTGVSSQLPSPFPIAVETIEEGVRKLSIGTAIDASTASEGV
jgi:hypothetical protein